MLSIECFFIIIKISLCYVPEGCVCVCMLKLEAWIFLVFFVILLFWYVILDFRVTSIVKISLVLPERILCALQVRFRCRVWENLFDLAISNSLLHFIVCRAKQRTLQKFPIGMRCIYIIYT
jgi:hypothetical protein